MHKGPDSRSRPGKALVVLVAVLAVAAAYVVFGSAADVDDPRGVPVREEAGQTTSGSAAPAPRPLEDPSETPESTVALPAAGVATTRAPSPPSTATTDVPTTTTTNFPARTCQAASARPDGEASSSLSVVYLTEGNPSSLAIAVSERLYTCADVVVIAHPFRLFPATVAAQLAVHQGAPLLYYLPGSPWQEELASELGRLAPRQIWMMTGVPDALAPAGAEIVRLPSELEDLIAWIEFNRPTLGTGRFPAFDHRSLHSLVMMGGGLGMALAPFSWPLLPPSDSLIMGSSTRPLRSPRLWVVDPNRPLSGLVVAAAATALGDGAVYWDPEEGGILDEAGRVLVEQAEGMAEVLMVGQISESGRWLLETTLWGEELPGGGQILFPHRRLVAFYGGVTTRALGVLGEQGPAETLERLRPYLEDYAADGVVTVPTFEIITTLATAGPGRDGDYSGEYLIETLMPWIEYAAQNDIYVVLDLQPGRSDFLSQAKQYEELLRLPNVGLALDPEWRLGPNEVHLVQIGSVDGQEVNTVIDWLSELVRRERLPQKLLIVHQFRLDMITNRDLLRTPPELAVMIHMDGQGGQGAKDNTWNTLVRGTEDREWWWGWKNFFDEDFPTADPQRVLDLEPVVYFVSYQ